MRRKERRRGDVTGRKHTNTSAVPRNNDPLYFRHATYWPPIQKSPLFSLSMNVDCDKGILTTSASLSFPLFPLFFAPFVCFFPLLNLRWIVIMWSKRAPSSPLNEKRKKKWGTKSSSVHMRKEKKIGEKAWVSPIYGHSLPESRSLTYREKCSRSARTQPGELSWDFPAPGAVNRGPAETDTPGISLPLRSWGFAARPRVNVSVLDCVCQAMLMGRRARNEVMLPRELNVSLWNHKWQFM